MDFSKIVIVSCYLFSLFDVGYTCSCYMVRHQNSFCRADFAIKANITDASVFYTNGESESIRNTDNLSQNLEQEYFNYTVDILDVFKSTTAYDNADQRMILSSAASGMCGVQLQYNRVYYLTGHVSDGSLFVSSCSAIAIFDEMTETQLIGITGLYGRNCKCRVSGQMLEPRWRKKRVCRANDWSICEDKNAICKRVRGGRCRWQYPENANLCP